MSKRDMMACIPVAALALMMGLPACSPAPKPSSVTPGLYRNLAKGEALDARIGAEMISSYRANQGLGPLALDTTLQEMAQAEAQGMAMSGMPRASQNFQNRISAKGYSAVQAHGTAGYQTLAEAFSGWRESSSHNGALLSRQATRMGIAAHYEAGAKYKVYWVFISAR
jgi:uncharacterized protein YkwD